MYFEQFRKKMINRLEQMGISDIHVLEAMGKIPREKFLSAGLEFQAYDEKALPIGFGQTISHPYTVAKMTEELKIEPGDKVLEIGTGSGYQAALLCEMGVILYTIEKIPELAKNARQKLISLGYTFTLKNGDGSIGFSAYAPYSSIIVTAGVNEVPSELIDQLDENGRLIIPVGNKEEQLLTIYKKEGNEITQQTFDKMHFVPLIGKKGW